MGSHPNELGHSLMAAAIDRLQRERCAAAKQQGTTKPAKRPMQRPTFPAQTCALGQSLKRLVLNSSGFVAIDPGGGRTPGLGAVAAGSQLVLRLNTSELISGFISLGIERGFRNRGVAKIRCLPPCSCGEVRFDTSTSGRKRYTFTQRSGAQWAVSTGGECLVEVSASRLESGRVFLTALTFSAPLSSGRGRHGKRLSVSTNSLFFLMHHDD